MSSSTSLLLHLRRHLHLHPRPFSTLPPPSSPHPTSKDAYFAAVHHLSTIVRRDFYLERTLNRLRLPSPFPPDLALHILRSSAPTAPLAAVRFLSWLRSHPSFRPSAPHFDALLLPLARHRLFSHLWSVTSEMRKLDLPLPPSTFAAVIAAYGAARLPDLAVDVFNRLPRFGCAQTTEIYNSLLAALCGNGNFTGAYALLRRMARKAVPPDRTTFSTLVDAWCAAGKLKEAQDFLDDMARRGFRPPVRGRDLLVDGLVRAGHLDEAKAIARRMTKEGILPDVATFNSLVEALCNARDVDFAVALLDDAASRGLSADISTYKVMVPAVAKSGQIEEAFRLFYAAIEDGHRPFPSLYAAIIKALCKAGRFADAFAFFGDMKVQGHAPNRPAYVMLVKMCVRGGRFVEAANYLTEMMEVGLTPRAQSFNVVVDGLRHCGKHDLAWRMEQLEVSLRDDDDEVREVSDIRSSKFEPLLSTLSTHLPCSFEVIPTTELNPLENIENMPQCCMEMNLVLSWEKSHFMVKQDNVLGHIVSQHDIEVDKSNVDLISKLPPLTTIKQVRFFLGHIGFYRRFIKNFSAISRPLCSLFVKNTQFIFDDTCLNAFYMLRDALIKTHIMQPSN